MGRALVNWIGKTVKVALMLAAFLCARVHAGEKGGSDLELKVKAVLLVKLISYVDWPTNAFAGPDAPFQIAVLGADPFGGILEKAFEGELPKGRRPEIRRVQSAGECASCQMIFISGSEKDRFVDQLREIIGAHVLTVSDLEKFARKGGMVGMATLEKNVKFEVNIEACKQAGLAVSSRLSSLARVVTSDK